MFKNISIKGKLVTVFVGFFVFIVVIILYALLQMSTLGTITDKIANDRIPKIMALSEISKQVNLIARAARNMYIFKDKAMVNEEKNTIMKSREMIGQKLDYLKPIIKNPKAIVILTEIFETRKEFIVAQDKFIMAIEKDDSEAAYDVLLKEFRPIQLKYISSLDTLLEFQSQSSQKEANDAIGFISTVSTNIAIASILFAILLIFFGITLIRSIINPIHILEKAVIEIGQNGNFDAKFEIHSEDEMGTFAKNFQEMMSNLKSMLADASMLSSAAVEGKLSTRANATKYKGDMRKIVEGVNNTLDAVIGPLNVAADYVDKISRGVIPPKITDTYNGDFNVIKNNLNLLIQTLNEVTSSQIELTKIHHEQGLISERIDASKFSGVYADMANNVNSLVEQHIQVKMRIVEVVTRYSIGDLNVDMDRLPGQKAKITDSIDSVKKSLISLNQEILTLVNAAIAGKLSTRADANKFQFTFKEMVSGINQTLDAVIGPLNVAADYVDKISQGIIPEPITKEYFGDFNTIKSNLNILVNTLNRFQSDMKTMTNEQKAGDIDYYIDPSGFKGIYKTMAEGVVDNVKIHVTNILEILNTVGEYGEGNLTVELKKLPGKQIIANQKVDKVRSNLYLLTEEIEMLTQAAVNGKLSTRGNSKKFKGSYTQLIDGVNNILDAVILPIQEASSVLLELSKGNLRARVTGDYKGDHATIKTALNSSLVTLNEYVGEISRVLSSMSSGDLTIDVTKDFAGDFAEIKKALTLIVDSFNELIGEIINASDQILISSRQVADSSQSLSQGSNEQASSVEEITATLAVIELKAKDNANNAKNASERALSVKEQAVASNNEMKGMLKAMEEISDTSENIAKIIKEIDAIAFQTNILALNAAVEAARAGQHGKGFNVVAEEVRNLASRSANAAKETTKMIEGSIKTVRSGMDIAGRTANELNKMTAGVVDVTELVKDIATASIEQSSSVVETTSGINQISQVTMSAAATAEESSAASLELSSQAEAFQAMVKRFQIKRSRDEKKNIQSSTKRKIDLK